METPEHMAADIWLRTDDIMARDRHSVYPMEAYASKDSFSGETSWLEHTVHDIYKWWRNDSLWWVDCPSPHSVSDCLFPPSRFWSLCKGSDCGWSVRISGHSSTSMFKFFASTQRHSNWLNTINYTLTLKPKHANISKLISRSVTITIIIIIITV